MIVAGQTILLTHKYKSGFRDMYNGCNGDFGTVPVEHYAMRPLETLCNLSL